VTTPTISPDTDRRLVTMLVEQGVASREAVSRLAEERTTRIARGEPLPSLARLLCDRGIVARPVAARLLAQVRAERALVTRGRGPLPALGPYELLGELGRGGMGCVYRARHVPTGAIRALKVLTGETDGEAIARFRREAQSLARVGGTGVVPIHDAGVAQGKPFFAMALLPGGSLRDRLKTAGKLPWREATTLVAEVARVLERCHAAGIVHRDVKPDNVLLDDAGRPWLADFGCVRDLGASRLTETGVGLGTIRYMSPEQLQGIPVDGRADIYALAVVLHELIAGAPPYPGRSPVAQLAERAAPRPRLADAPLAPPDLDRVLDRALALDAASRTASAGELASGLEQILAGEKLEVAAGGPGKLAVGLAAGVVLSLALAAASIAYRSGHAPPAPARVVAPPPPASSPPPVVEHVPTDAEEVAALVSQVRLDRLSPERSKNAAWRSHAPALYRLGLREPTRAHELLLAAHRLAPPPEDPGVRRDLAWFWSSEIAAIEDLPAAKDDVDKVAPYLSKIDDKAREAFLDKIERSLSEELACFVESYSAASCGDRCVPWGALAYVRLIDSTGSETGHQFASQVLRCWPDCPTLALVESAPVRGEARLASIKRGADELARMGQLTQAEALGLAASLAERAFVTGKEVPRLRDAALEIVRELERAAPSSLTLRLTLARALDDAGSWAELAAIDVSPAEVVAPGGSGLLNLRLHALDELDRFDDFDALGARISDAAPRSREALEPVVAMLQHAYGTLIDRLCAGQPDRAIALARGLYARTPDLGTRYTLMATLASTRHDAEALELGVAADDLASVAAQGMLDLRVRTLCRLGRGSEAEAEMAHVAAHWSDGRYVPGEVKAYLPAGQFRLLYSLGKNDEALASARDWHRADPASAQSRLGLALSLERAGRWQEIADLVTYVPAAVDDSATRATLECLVRALGALGRADEARRIAGEVGARYPDFRERVRPALEAPR
jgi:tetratricopeptide (TPR) repeat protein